MSSSQEYTPPDPNRLTHDNPHAALALDGMRKAIRPGDEGAIFTYFRSQFSAPELSTLFSASVRTIEQWSKHGLPTARRTIQANRLLKAFAVVEYLDTHVGLNAESQADFLRSYTIDPATNDAVSMIELIGSGNIPSVIDHADRLKPTDS